MPIQGIWQEFDVYSRVIQGKQEMEIASLTPSWLQVKPGGTPRIITEASYEPHEERRG
jgi:hypothetical protein